MTIMEMPTVYEALTRRVPVGHIYDQWLLFTDGFYLVSKEYMQKVKRLVDFVISALLLLGTLPITALSALAIRFDSPDPVFFKQERVGKNGMVFVLWKFRSMREDAEKNGAVWAELY
jgi:lipopolysaccharide/colanic/teichoic acid biosynthesis glycosyltransferase